jgi:hypothetical protein
MPLDDDRHGRERVTAKIHGDGGCRHQQVHEPVADGAREHRDDEHRLADDDGQRPALARALVQRRPRNVDERLHEKREQSVARERDEAAEVGSLEETGCAPHGLRTEKPADHTAREHERDRFGPVGRRGDLRRREPVLEADRVVDADHRRCRAVQCEARATDRERRERTAANVDGAPAMKPLRLPILAMSREAGIVVTADPSTYMVTPSVASALVSASV